MRELEAQTRSETSLGSFSRRRTARWCFVWMKRTRFRRSTARSLSCRCCWVYTRTLSGEDAGPEHHVALDRERYHREVGERPVLQDRHRPSSPMPLRRIAARDGRRLRSPVRAAAAFSASCARCVYPAVMPTFVWPSNLPIMNRLSPSAKALPAKLCGRSWIHTSSSTARPSPAPGMLQVGKVGAGLPADDHPGIALVPGSAARMPTAAAESGTIRAPVFESRNRSSAAFSSTSSQRKVWISPSRQPVSICRRTAATADGVSAPAASTSASTRRAVGTPHRSGNARAASAGTSARNGTGCRRPSAGPRLPRG